MTCGAAHPALVDVLRHIDQAVGITPQPTHHRCIDVYRDPVRELRSLEALGEPR